MAAAGAELRGREVAWDDEFVLAAAQGTGLVDFLARSPAGDAEGCLAPLYNAV